MKNHEISSNLCGRIAKGWWYEDNPDYVFQYGHSKKEIAALTDHQKKARLFHKIEGEIVAVTPWDGHDDKLQLWILVDGRPRRLSSDTVVMPRGYARGFRDLPPESDGAEHGSLEDAT